MEEEGNLKGLSLQAFQNSYFAGLIRTCPFPVFPVIVPVPVKFGIPTYPPFAVVHWYPAPSIMTVFVKYKPE